jgi:hypothetical protein
MIAPGAQCRITRGPLGMVAHPDAAAFEREVVRAGAMATYLGKHPQLDGWHLLIAVGHVGDPGGVASGRALFVPASEAQFEVTA